VATFFIIRGVGGIADSLEERMERVGERDERIQQKDPKVGTITALKNRFNVHAGRHWIRFSSPTNSVSMQSWQWWKIKETPSQCFA